MTQNLALFDFDGTITSTDTFIKFIQFAKGSAKLFVGFALLTPYLILMKLKVYPNWKAKEKVMSFFFGGMSVSEFNRLGASFAKNEIPKYVKDSAMERLKFHKTNGDKIIIVSASFENWISDWAKDHCDLLLATRVEVSKDKLTGKIMGANCYGMEKVNRLKEVVDIGEFATIHAYGDSRGDKEMLDLATYANFRNFN